MGIGADPDELDPGELRPLASRAATRALTWHTSNDLVRWVTAQDFIAATAVLAASSDVSITTRVADPARRAP